MELNSLETFRSKIARGETALGCVITMLDPSVSELAAAAGFDFVWIDLEHSPLTIVDAMHHVMAVRGSGCAPFIRVPWNRNYLLKPVLDLAPAGVIIPMVNDAEAATAAVRACRYPSEGGERGFATRRATGYGRMPLAEYLEYSKREPLVIVQIEHRDAVRNLDEILAVPGIDSVCIGPFDLSSSYGKTGQFDDPEIIAAIDLIREKTTKAGLLLGGFCARTPFWEQRQMDWRALGTDTEALFQSFRDRILNLPRPE